MPFTVNSSPRKKIPGSIFNLNVGKFCFLTTAVNPVCSSCGVPALVVKSPMLNFNIAGFEFVNSTTLKKLYPLSSELNPLPGEVTLPRVSVKDCFLNPSTKISSPTANGGFAKPSIGGVLNSRVTMPLL